MKLFSDHYDNFQDIILGKLYKTQLCTIIKVTKCSKKLIQAYWRNSFLEYKLEWDEYCKRKQIKEEQNKQPEDAAKNKFKASMLKRFPDLMN